MKGHLLLIPLALAIIIAMTIGFGIMLEQRQSRITAIARLHTLSIEIWKTRDVLEEWRGFCWMHDRSRTLPADQGFRGLVNLKATESLTAMGRATALPLPPKGTEAMSQAMVEHARLLDLVKEFLETSSPTPPSLLNAQFTLVVSLLSAASKWIDTEIETLSRKP